MTSSQSTDAHAVKDAVAQDAGVVDDAVDAAEVVDRRLDDALGAAAGRQRCRRWPPPRRRPSLISSTTSCAGASTSPPSPSAAPPRSLTTTLAPSARRQQRDLAADAAARAGDDDDFTGENSVGHPQLSKERAKAVLAPGWTKRQRVRAAPFGQVCSDFAGGLGSSNATD